MTEKEVQEFLEDSGYYRMRISKWCSTYISKEGTVVTVPNQCDQNLSEDYIRKIERATGLSLPKRW